MTKTETIAQTAAQIAQAVGQVEVLGDCFTATPESYERGNHIAFSLQWNGIEFTDDDSVQGRPVEALSVTTSHVLLSLSGGKNVAVKLGQDLTPVLGALTEVLTSAALEARVS